MSLAAVPIQPRPHHKPRQCGRESDCGRPARDPMGPSRSLPALMTCIITRTRSKGIPYEHACRSPVRSHTLPAECGICVSPRTSRVDRTGGGPASGMPASLRGTPRSRADFRVGYARARYHRAGAEVRVGYARRLWLERNPAGCDDAGSFRLHTHKARRAKRMVPAGPSWILPRGG
jgi:hypothetical protein